MPPKLVLKKPKAQKEEGAIYVTSTGRTFLAPKIDARSIMQILENKYIKEGLDKQQRILFQDDLDYQVIDIATEEIEPDLTHELKEMCLQKGVSLDFQIQRAFRDVQEWGCALLSPGWIYEGSEYRLNALNRLPPETFTSPGNSYSLIHNRILPGICINDDNQEIEFWQTQPDGKIDQLTNIFMMTDPLSSELGGTPFIIPIFPYVKMASYAWQRQMQKVNIWGSGGLWTIKVTDPQGDDKEYAQKFLNNTSSTNKFQLRPNMELENLGADGGGSALETIGEISMLIRQFFTPSNILEKGGGGTLIGGSNNAEFDLYMSYIKGVHRWLERAGRMLLEPWLLANGYADKYRIVVDIPAPKIDQSELFLKIAREGKMSGTITDNEHRDLLNAAGGELQELTEAEMKSLKEERQAEKQAAAPSPFGQKMQKAETLAKVIAANPLDPYALASRDKARDFIQKTLLDEGGAVPFHKSRQHISGGSGSGNFGHEGRPGEVGGSGEGSTTAGKTTTPALRKQDTKPVDISVKTISSGKGRGRAVDFDERPQDLAKYKNAPDNGASIMSMAQAVEMREELKEQGRLNPDGRTVSYWHVTDTDSADSIKEKGLVPGYHEAIGQEWKATHSDYATYFFGDKDTAVASLKDVIEVTQIKDSYVLVEAKIPVTPKSLIRILPDEDVSPDTTKYKQALVSGDSIAYVGGIPAHALTVHRVAEYEKPHKQGGAGSGNFDHAGRPGEVGGSAPADGSGSTAAEVKKDTLQSSSKNFDKVAWKGKRDDWKALSVSERDRLADAAVSVPRYESELLAPLGEWENTDDIRSDVANRIGSAQGEIDDAAAGRIELMTATYVGVLEQAGVPEEKSRLLLTMATDALIAQEMEAQNRQLGDHGSHHITGDIDRGMSILSQIPGEDTPEQQAILYTAAVFHDTGYLTDPSRVMLDEGHTRWGQQHYDENIAPTVEKVLGKEAAREISGMIRTHDTSTIDWEEDPVGSALRVADNTALFEQDKLPPVFRNVGGNTDALFDYAEKRIDLPTLKATMRENISKTDYPSGEKARYNRAVDEVGEKTAKYTLGMMGGSINSITWREDHIVLGLREMPDMTKFHNIMDLGQSQFGKLAESYGQDPEQFTKTLDFKFKNTAGKTVLEGVMVKSHRHGGEGSGNFGHAGRPGEVGGSAPEGTDFFTRNINEFERNPKTGRYERAVRKRGAGGKFVKKEAGTSPAKTVSEEEKKEDERIKDIQRRADEGRLGVPTVKTQEAWNTIHSVLDPTPVTAEKWQEYKDRVKSAPPNTPPEQIDEYLKSVEKEMLMSNPGEHLYGVSEQDIISIAAGLKPLQESGIKIREISVMPKNDPALNNPEGKTGAYFNEAGNCIRINPYVLDDHGVRYHDEGNKTFHRFIEEQEKGLMILPPDRKASKEDLIKATKGWSVATRDDLPASQYVESVINHEAWHAVDKVTGGSDALMLTEILHSVGQKEELGVSIYATQGGKAETWAEFNSAIDLGLPVPNQVREAVKMARDITKNRTKNTTKVVSI
jgi:hypothetical protein